MLIPPHSPTMSPVDGAFGVLVDAPEAFPGAIHPVSHVMIPTVCSEPESKKLIRRTGVRVCPTVVAEFAVKEAMCSKRQLNTASVGLVRRVIEDRQFYSSRRVAAAMCRQGIRMNRKAVQRIMGAMGWTLPVMKREKAFAGSERIRFIPIVPGELWETDITCVCKGIYSFVSSHHS